MASPAARKRKQQRRKDLVRQLKDEVSLLKKQLEEKKKRNPSSLVEADKNHFRNAPKQEISKWEWSGNDVSLTYGNFEGVNFRDVSMEDINANEASFKGADLRGTSFAGSSVKYADFTGAIFDRFTSFQKADFTGAIFDLSSLHLLINNGIQGKKYKVQHKDGNTVMVSNIGDFMKTLRNKYFGLLELARRVENDENDVVENARKEAEKAGQEFNPLDFEFDFKRRSKKIIKKYKALADLNIPQSFWKNYVAGPSMGVETILTDGIKREKARLLFKKEQKKQKPRKLKFWR